jgi:hypothetical protein
MAFAIKTAPDEVINFTLQFALQMRDAFADSDDLLGEVTAKAGSVEGERKNSSGAFLFYDLKPGDQELLIESSDETPYYQPAKVTVRVPVSQPPPPAPQYPYPVFPDIRLADSKLMLSDPGQTVAYKKQRSAATLFPSVAYPYPEATTLIRGVVTHGGADNPLTGATVKQIGSNDPAYVTDDHGRFVLYWKNAPGIPKTVTLNVKADVGEKNVSVLVIRGLSASINIDL